MVARFGRSRSGAGLLGAAVCVALALPGGPGQAQTAHWDQAPPVMMAPPHPWRASPYSETCPTPTAPPVIIPTPTPAVPTTPTAPTTPTTPTMPTTPTTPEAQAPAPTAPTTPTTPEAQAPAATAMAGAGAGAEGASPFAAQAAGAVPGATFSAAGYIDSAIPTNQLRLRFDSAYDDNRPDRADFFYPKCGCFRVAGTDPNAPGPGSQPARKVDFQEFSTYLEVAASERLSGFAEVPFRWIDIALENGAPNENHHDIGDVNFGFKYALLYSQDTVLTLQLRTYAPTGDPMRGLGRNNWNLEPALLFYQRLSERLLFEGEFRDFIPIDSADDYAGNVIRYGGGLSYFLYNGCRFRVATVNELVGWTVLSGKETTESGASISAKGDTIVNVKTGLRFGFGEATEPGVLGKTDLYVGYGRALTGDVWYKDIFRVELRFRF